MRLSSLLLGLVALTAPLTSHALSASSTLARLSQRLAAAETTLAQLQAQTQTGYASPNVLYNFNNNLYSDSTGVFKAANVPSGATNIILVSNTARGSTVLQRAASTSQANTYTQISYQLPANPFTIGIFVNWGGYSNPNSGDVSTILSAANDQILLQVNGAGQVSAKVADAVVSNVGTLVAGKWTHYTLVWNGQLAVYVNGQPTAAATTAVTPFPGASEIWLLNSASRTTGFVGLVDSLAIWNVAFDDMDANFYYSDQAATTGLSPVIVNDANRWWGHTTNTGVQFANNIQSQPTGDITVTGTIIDAEFRASNQLWWILYGVTGPTNANGVTIDYQGTKGILTWDEKTGILVYQPSADFQKIPTGVKFSFTFPGSALNLVNPNVNKLAGPNDPRWVISQFWLDLDQTPGKTRKQTALHWQGVTDTPITINNNPALL